MGANAVIEWAEGLWPPLRWTCDREQMDEFRQRCRAFLESHATGNPEPGPADPRGDRAMEIARTFQRALFDAGLAGICVPVEYGGQGLSPAHQAALNEALKGLPADHGARLLAEVKVSLLLAW